MEFIEMEEFSTISPIEADDISDNSNEATCDVCSNCANAVSTATAFCWNCSCYLCEACCRVHQRTRLTEEHILLVGNQIPKSQTRISNSTIVSDDTFCRRHNELFKFFCKSDETLCCPTCFFDNHRQCAGLERLCNVARDVKESPGFKRALQSTSNLITGWTRVMQTKAAEIRKVEHEANSALDRVTELKQKLILHIEEMEKVSKQKIDEVKNMQIRLIQDQISQCEKAVAELEVLHKTLKQSEINDTVEKTFISLKATEPDIRFQEELFARQQRSLTAVSVRFTFARSIEDVLTSSTFGEFCAMHHSRETSANNVTHPPHTSKDSSIEDMVSQQEKGRGNGKKPETSVPHNDGRPALLRIPRSDPRNPCKYNGSKLTETYDVKLTSDTHQCRVIGMCRLPDGSFVMADAGNNKLKHFCHRFKFKSALELPSSPWGLACVGENEVAVALPNQMTIQFIDTQTELFVKRTIRTEGCCRGVAYNSRTNMLIITSDSPSKLEILDMDGNIQERISRDRQGNDLFKGPFFLAVNEANSLIYVSETKRSRLYCFTMAGELVFSKKNINSPGGITFDPDGNLYVVELDSNTVKTCSARGSDVRNIVSKVRQYPWCIVYHRNPDCLVLGTSEGTIRVFNLKIYSGVT